MKHSLRGRIRCNYLLLAFLLPFLGMLTVMLLSQYEPFGHYSMLYSDMYHQYYPFFVAFRDALRGGHSLLYTWSVGMGMDYLGLISYYLASPLNLLSVLVPENWTLEFFSLLMPVKLGLASLFFAVFLKNLFHKNDLSIALFGGFYGLCAWALGYQWNVMWLDTFALLPLVALGTVQLIQQKKFVLYTLTLFLSVYANYYIGFFTCIFVFLLFFSVEICRWRGWKKFFRDLCRIALFSILAIGMLFSALKEVRPNATEHCGRAGEGKRTADEIGVSSLRMGGVVGVHEVHICTGTQSLTLCHDAMTRGMLADGAVDAARFMVGRGRGLYGMDDLLKKA